VRGSFYESTACASRQHCDACRNNPKFRARVLKTFAEPAEADYACMPLGLPIGVPTPADLPARRPKGGPGTELKKLFATFGFQDVPGCSCVAHAAEMDRRGADWCEANIETVVGWLREEKDRRGIVFPFFGSAARVAVNLAISRARESM
jgi:hypothetical protein